MEIPFLPSKLQQGANVIKQVVKTLTLQPGVYRMINERDEILYIGKAKNLKNRVVSYTHIDALPNRLKRMVSETVRMEIVTTHTETEALLLESNLIKHHLPRYNILLKDDKSFPYIVLTKDHPFPRVVKHRGAHTLKADYYGPFANVMAVDEAIEIIQKVFKVRNCTDHYFETRKRPCLQYHIKRCTAPCVQNISKQEYAESLEQAKNFLLGKTDEVQKILSDKMMRYSDDLEFEKAAQLRDTLKMMTDIQSKQRINLHGLRNADVVGVVKKLGLVCVQMFFFRHGRNYGTESFYIAHAQEEDEAAILNAFLLQFYSDRQPPEKVLLSHKIEDEKLLKQAISEKFDITVQFEVPKLNVKAELIQHVLKNANDSIDRKIAHSDSFQKLFTQIQSTFGLPGLPKRIEIYDNSHLQGSNPCGVMVVATSQGFEKKSYRKFTPKEAASNDDFGMMREFLKRRLKHLEDWDIPDLLLIDGGQGQLSSVQSIVDELGLSIPVVGIAKGPDRNAGRERFFMVGKEPFSLPLNDPLLYFLQRLRDEAHRFAIGTHRQKREKNLLTSKLDQIPGVGASRKKKLLLHFGSAKNVERAAVSDLCRVDGISRSLAQKIYDYFHS